MAYDGVRDGIRYLPGFLLLGVDAVPQLGLAALCLAARRTLPATSPDGRSLFV